MSRNETTTNSILIHELFEAAVLQHTERIAVTIGTVSITYEDLNTKASRLAVLISANADGEEIIGISATRSIEMVIGILAILKSGRAYLPLDPTYPEQRLQQIVGDSGVRTCIASTTESNFFCQFSLQTIAADQEHAISSASHPKQGLNVCILYTSGSTGLPKGVCLGHASMTNFILWQQTHALSGPNIQALQFCHLSFDASFMELFVPLITGGTVHLIREDDRLDGGRLLNFIISKKINKVFLPYVTLQYLTEAATAENRFPADLKEVITGGELLKITPTIRKFFGELPESCLWNIYGPTETTVCVTTLRLDGDTAAWPGIPTIGSVMAGSEIYFLDEQLQLVENGTAGELCITGVCLANGYLNKPELTAEKFVEWVHPLHGPMKIYRTGDLGSYKENGEIDFIGRRDGQVKIRGNRVELGEIEVALMQSTNIRQAVVILREDQPGRKTLAAYLVCEEGTFDAAALRASVASALPDYMVPASFSLLPELPKTTSGKVDKKALPKPDLRRPDLNVLYKRPVSATEKKITSVLEGILLYDKVGIEDNFFELGGNSLLAQKLVSELRYQLNLLLPITKLYQYPTISGIVKYLGQQQKGLQSVARVHKKGIRHTDIAVIGMAGRFPGADTVSELWELLIKGKEATTFFSTDELDPAIPEDIRKDPAYVKARGIIRNADQFDPAFFGINPKLAVLMDPQQRIFLEIAQEVLEQTGHLPNVYTHKVGVFAGSGSNTYYENNVLSHKNLIERQGKLQVLTVNEKDYIASRTAYHLNLKGPAVSVNSACSTSLLAVVEAVNSLRAGQCDVAIAGGASITSPVNSGHLYQEGSMLSEDGHCRPFDSEATGTVFSDGAGVVLLKRLDDAERDGDLIYGVVKGVGANNDGAGKGSFTAPNADSQADAIAMAIADAQVDPADISYIETHGTGTPLGDPIEFDGLNAAFGLQQKNQYCAIGSVKSNFGHLTQAAGVTGLIKTCMALHHRQIPASLGYKKPNPNINFADSPFYVNDELRAWPTGKTRIAGVSSFGVGGTNVHVVVEEYINKEKPSSEGRPFELISFSAQTPKSLSLYGDALAKKLDHYSLADIAYTLHTTRDNYRNRRFIVTDSVGHLHAQLGGSNTSKIENNLLEETPGEVVFTFPGQGAQYLNMARELYQAEPVYTAAIDECATLLSSYLDADIRTVLFPEEETAAAANKLKDTKYTQPALFVTEYALAKLWMHWGIEPTLFCGHSIGEYVAAHLSGIFSLEDGLRLIAARAAMVSALPGGGMLSVRHDREEVLALLSGGTLSMAAVNSPKLCVVAGPTEALQEFSKLLDSKEVVNKLLFTSHAFHSSMMDPILEDFRKVVAEITLSAPQIPIISTVTGKLMLDDEAMSADYWTGHLRNTVLFADAVSTILTYDQPLFLEVGPGVVTSTLVKQIAAGESRKVKAINSLNNGTNDHYSILTALGYLWNQGLQPNWDNYYEMQQRKLLHLPAYQFDRSRYWVDIITNTSPAQPAIQARAEQQTESNELQLKHVLIMRKNNLSAKIKQVLEDASGIEMEDVASDSNFLEIGLDSLLLTQVAISLKREFGLPITFRKLNEEYSSVDLLVDYIDANTAPDPVADAPLAVTQPAVQATPQAIAVTPTAQPAQAYAPPVYSAPVYNSAPVFHQQANDTAMSLIAQQLEILSKQVMMMQGMQSVTVQLSPPPPPASVVAAAATPSPKPAVKKQVSDLSLSAQEQEEIKKPFGATPKIERQSSDLNPKQQSFLKELTARYTKRTAKSKAYAAESRDYMADPRVVSGFKPQTKELIYPIVIKKSSGSKMWDLDDNEYIDVLNGFGSNMLGYQPEVIKKAMHDQVDKGYEVGPQHELAAEVSKMVCEFTGFDRSALCSTGSEAVLGCIRIARTVTGRSLIVAFTGSYHGIIDEVLVRGTKKLKSFPAAAGIMPEAVQNILVLDYGTEESLAIIRERADEIAAVIAEPIQSRRPEFVPVEFLRKVREITENAGAALIFDEVITGFRMHPGGAQALFGIRADLASYGKVVGAGIPIGVIAGKKQFMDALDGGTWNYGDASFPEVGVTYFAGTFVRHPLALASAKASLEYMREKGPALQEQLNEKGNYISKVLNEEITKRNLPFFVANYGSLWKVKFNEEVPYGELMFTLMREKGIHILDGFPCFITEATSNEDLQKVIECFKESMDEMIAAGFYESGVQLGANTTSPVLDINRPPMVGARLGKDKDGNPAWFIEDDKAAGKFLQINHN
ncbi:non-ribosomal peptide synthetase/polyketide synthase [Pedobacter sp. BAL39]|uniref:type I polyketide synthase n=1 Tax=Pedobacter sp. BAL39 TaxID=391596 RepID=UPI00015596C1|nr:type I polyketide synthase [Pedobacter sp. BAL39]EDM38252.1 non-ribosomal peptide synthetase/polyketide synthase [Pedobacter sp. BAL39]